MKYKPGTILKNCMGEDCIIIIKAYDEYYSYLWLGEPEWPVRKASYTNIETESFFISISETLCEV